MENKDTVNSEIILESNKNKKKHGFFYYFLNILLWVIIGACVIYTGLNVIDKKTGYSFLPSHTCVVVSGSMSTKNPVNTYLTDEDKQIQINDVVVSNNYSNFDDVNYKDVILYLGEDGILVCHRVIDKYVSGENSYIVCRGDANSSNDRPVNFNRVRGKIVNVIPGIGGFIQFVQSVYFLIALFFTAFFILLGVYIYNYSGKKNKKEHKEEDEKAN